MSTVFRLWVSILAATILVTFGITGCSGSGNTSIFLDSSDPVDQRTPADGMTDMLDSSSQDTPPQDSGVDTVQPQCKTGDDCVDLEVPVCQVAQCSAEGLCVLGNAEDGLECESGNPCATGAACLDGACVVAELKSCVDDNPCTEDSCLAETGECEFVLTANGTPCDLGLCWEEASCQDGLCSGTARDCDDQNSCTQDLCDHATGCVHNSLPAGTLCTDLNACTEEDLCVAGVCTGSSAPDCNDNNPCTQDSCEPESGCVFAPLSNISCNDGNICTQGDACVEGQCMSGASVCDCSTIDDCLAYEDDDLCNGTFICLNNVCVIDPETVVQCPDQGESDCMTTACIPDSGQCVQIQAQDGQQCSDDNICTTGETCLDGVCQGSSPVFCQDNNSCTQDSCEPGLGCVFTPVDGECDDGNPCTQGDQCEAGLCSGGQNTCDCSVNEDCLANEDGNVCNGTLICLNQVCVVDPATLITCAQPDNECLVSECQPDSGICLPINQVDGIPCNDQDLCTDTDRCLSGVCVGQENDCWDGNPCTMDSCEPLLGCVYTVAANGTSCDDEDACTSPDVCSAGNCIGIDDVQCNDMNDCTMDSCSHTDGCIFAPLSDIPCSDNDPCTGEGGADLCLSGVCIPGDNSCQCNSKNDCLPFEDGDLCNGVYACENHQCVLDPTTIVSCDHSADTTCRFNVCDPASGQCMEINELDGSPCDDQDACTQEDVCLGGACFGSETRVCQDSNPCTVDLCLPEVGCIHEPIAVPCEDGNPCTSNDFCQEGECTSGENICQCQSDGDCADYEDDDVCNGTLICSDFQCLLDPTTVVVCPASENQCLSNVCQPLSGECVEQPLTDGTVCDDEDACTTGDECVAGVCRGAEELSCEDGNPCTEDLCDASSGCFFPNLVDAECTDGDPCTGPDLCQDGECISGANVCDCQQDSDCVQTEDYLCRGRYSCQDNFCILDPTTIVVCDSSTDTTCMKNTCDTGSGLCQMTPVADGLSCSDSDICTEQDECFDGQCVGVEVVCEDGNPCTDDACVASSGGCVFIPNNQECDDGDICTQSDFCVGTVCRGEALNCNDSNPCTLDQCNPQVGCTHSNLQGTCSDNNLCTTGDRCVEGRCLSDGVASCDDGNVCTTDTCEPATGCSHKNNTDLCDDGEPCTEGDTCANGLCVAGSDADCDDSNPCTIDFCEPGEGCRNDPISGSPCNTENRCLDTGVCEVGVCVAQPLNCDDGNPCTTETCQESTGCVYKYLNNVPCNDGSLCTTSDRCLNGVCLGGTMVNCDDGIVCTLDGCDPTTGCFNNPSALNGQGCDDDDACTAGDVCLNGVCEGSPIPPCNDSNPCTMDSCSPLMGCVFTPSNGTACDDSDPCTEADTCLNGACLGSAVNCDDSDPCTQDLCDSSQGCFNPPVADDQMISCDDQDDCTTVDQCVAGACVGVSFKNCDDDNVCTADSCDSATGACVHTPVSGSCNDGLACTLTDTCQGGVCVGGNFKICNDNNVCTDDSCVETGGGRCLFTPNTNGCDDGNPCSDGDYCSDGTCIPGGNICGCNTNADCLSEEDGNLCNGTLICVQHDCIVDPATVVTCNASMDTDCLKNRCAPETGLCSMTEATDGTPCEDGSLCQTNTVCGGGVCVGSPVLCSQDSNPCTLSVCDQNTGACVVNYLTTACDDGNACTVGDQCQQGTCIAQPYDCDDGNGCTWDYCVARSGAPSCFHTNNTQPCNDNNLCTENDRCSGGVCGGTIISCDDGNLCTWDFCYSSTGCVWEYNDVLCDDGDLCTLGDACQDGECVGAAVDCDDDNPCTADVCFPGYGECHNMVITGACDDQNLCTEGDSCIDGFCEGSEVQCDDDNVCTLDYCDPNLGCATSILEGFVCDDGNVCTTLDSCGHDGQCGGIRITDCCATASDCMNTFSCNTATCEGTTCVYSTVPCADSNDCTVDWCNDGQCLHDPYVGDEVTVYYEGFEDEEHGWQFYKATGAFTNQVYWSVVTRRFFSGLKSLYAGQPSSGSYNFGNVDTWAVSPSISIPGDTDGAVLSFMYFAGLDEQTYNYDFMEVYVEANGERHLMSPRLYQTMPWTLVEIDVSEFIGEEIRIRFRFATGDGTDNVGEGFYVDDIQIFVNPKDGCCGYDGDCEDGNLCSRDICSDDYRCTYGALEGSYLYQTFDSGLMPQGWTTSQTQDKLSWSVDNGRSTSTPFSLYGGSPSDHSYNHGAGQTVITSDTFKLTWAIAPWLRFKLFSDLDMTPGNLDKLLIQAVDVTVPTNPVIHQLGELSMDTQGAFVLAEQSLAALIGKSIKLELVFNVTAANNLGEGLYIDDIRVEEDGTQNPGCCQTSSQCVDSDLCTRDVCAGVPGAGVCIFTPVSKVVEAFDTGVATGWQVTEGTNGVTWHVSNSSSVSPSYSLYGAKPQFNKVWGVGSTTAYSKPMTVKYTNSNQVFLSYARQTSIGNEYGSGNLLIRLEYRMTEDGVWQAGSTVENVTWNEAWLQKAFTLTYPTGAWAIRIAFIYNFNVLSSCTTYSTCPLGVRIDDFRLGFAGCWNVATVE